MMGAFVGDGAPFSPVSATICSCCSRYRPSEAPPAALCANSPAPSSLVAACTLIFATAVTRASGRRRFCWTRRVYLGIRNLHHLARCRPRRQCSCRLQRPCPHSSSKRACFEIITSQVDNVPVPPYVFNAFDLDAPAAARNFSYAAMLYADGTLVDHWGRNKSCGPIGRSWKQGCGSITLRTSTCRRGQKSPHFGQMRLNDF